MQTSFWDTDPSSPLSGTTKPPACSSGESTTDGSPACSCTTETCGCSTHPNTRAEWIASMQDSLARIFQSPVLGQALRESEAVCGAKSLELLATWDAGSCFWRTAQQSLEEDLEVFCETWPSWGLMRAGACYPLRELVPRTFALDGGVLQDWQTPVADDAVNRSKGKYNSRGEPKLSAQVKFPTPTAQAAGAIDPASIEGEPKPNSRLYSRKTGNHMQVTLCRFVKLWPTPTATAYKGSSPAAMTRKSGESRERDRLDHAVMASDGGQLNPVWVEWLMGWPIGATE